MDLEELKTTDIWDLYTHGKDFMRMNSVFTDTDRNYRMYSGNQWEGAKIEGIEQAQYNFIETIVNYKVSTINQNLWGINYSSENFENRDFRKTAEETCKLLNKKAGKVWEKDQMDYKVREISEDSAVNDEGVMYVDYNDVVTAGQLIAEMDKVTLEAELQSATAQLDKTKFLDGVQRVTEALVIVQCNMKTAHGHDAGNSMAGGTGTNNSDILNHNKTPPCFNSLPLMPVAPGRAVTMCGTLTDIYYKKLGITIQIGNCGGVYHRFRCNLSTKDPRYRYSVPGI